LPQGLKIADPRQEHDLSAKQPDLVSEMSTEFERWWKAIEAFLIHEKQTIRINTRPQGPQSLET